MTTPKNLAKQSTPLIIIIRPLQFTSAHLPKAARHFCHQRTHWGNVDDLEFVFLNGAICVNMLANLT